MCKYVYTIYNSAGQKSTKVADGPVAFNCIRSFVYPPSGSETNRVCLNRIHTHTHTKVLSKNSHTQ